MLETKTAIFKVGQNVRYVTTGKIGTINSVIKQTRGYSYKVMVDGKVKTIAERFLEPFEDAEENLVELLQNEKFGRYRDYRIFQTWFRLTRPLEKNIYSYLGSKTVFNPHQFKPLLRFLSPTSDERLFIADEVGVGKTIEAGIILTEMISRGRLDERTPILIVCPNSLGPKWIKEMKERFQLNFHLHNGQSLKYSLDSALREGRIPARYNYSIVSLQLLRSERYLRLLKEIDSRREFPLFGMVIVDEAHHMRNVGTDSNDLGNVLSGMTEMMLMLSATPLNLKNEDLYNQMHILNPAVFPDWQTFKALQAPAVILNRIRKEIHIDTKESRSDILFSMDELKNIPLGDVILSQPGVKEFCNRLDNSASLSAEEIVRYERFFATLSPLYSSFTRTRKREALQHQVKRDAKDVPITLSEKEMRFHNNIIAAIEQYYLSKGGDRRELAFVTNTHRRMISSSIPAMREYLKWAINENKIEVANEYFLDAEDDTEVKYQELTPELRNKFEQLLKETTEIEEIDSKYETFKKVIDKILANPETSQIIVFSFFIRTLEYLKRRLKKDGITVGIIHGRIPIKSDDKEPGRYDIMEDFKSGKFQILLSSEVGGEGLDFQYCHAILNYDLPYNPMRVEQRIGRIDRFGQLADKIIVANLFIKDTVDEEIYERLYKRIRLVEDGIGALEPILGNQIADLQNMIITGKLSPEEIEERTKRLQESIESAKQQMEEFEKHRAELLSDDYLAKPINKISEGSFISPYDIVELTKEFLSDRDGCEYTELAPSRGIIMLSESVKSLLSSFLRKPNNERGFESLDILLSQDMGVKVVFDGTIAEEYSNHLFLPPTGYWARFITYQLRQEGRIFKIFRFGIMEDVGIPSGEYFLVLFEVRIEGIRSEIEFLGIPVDIRHLSVVDTDFEALPRIIAGVDGRNIKSDSNLGSLDVNAVLDLARDYLADFLEERRGVAEEENLFKINSRIAALKRASESRIKTIEHSLERHKQKRREQGVAPSEKYVRLMQARIENEKARLKVNIEGLMAKTVLSMDYSLEGVVYLKVGD